MNTETDRKFHEKFGDKTITIDAEQLVMAQSEALATMAAKNPMLFVIADTLGEAMARTVEILFKEDK